ncbi:MAG: hypothetical protein WBF58_19285 [Xanthobacteraceae bacterium]
MPPNTSRPACATTWRGAGIDKPGACHLFRHAMSTRMLDNGAGIRFIQAMSATPA